MGRAYRMQRMVQFAETDVAGVMHFSNYFRLMEEVEHAFWRSLGLSVHLAAGETERREELKRNAGVVEAFSWPRVAVSCEYFDAARFEDVLDLSFRITRVGDKSIEQEVEFARDGKRIALGRMKTVCCVMGRGGFRSITIPAAVREKLGE